jgi:hypothetical protein
MARSFGSQLAVVMTPRDELAFLDWLRQSADVQVLALDADSVDHVWLQALPPPGRNPRLHHGFVLWNRAFDWTPEIRPLALGAGVVNAARAPVIEYRRQPGSATSPDEGRLFWSRSITPGGGHFWQGGEYSYDAEQFQQWWQHVADGVRQRAHALQRDNAPPMHYLPDAWARRQGGGVLGRVAGWFRSPR